MDITQLTSLTNNLSDEQKLVFSEIYDAKKKSTFTAYVLLICFGAVGAHKFYLNNSKGWLYLLFFWTCIPGFIAFIELFTTKKQVDIYNEKLAVQIISLMNTYNNPDIARLSIPKLLKNNSMLGIIAGIILIIVVIAVFGAINKESTEKVTPTATTPEIKTPSVSPASQEKAEEKPRILENTTVIASDLYSEYQSNEARADNKYKGVLLSIRGRISDIHKYTSDTTTVSLSVGDEYGVGAVSCDVQSSNEILQKISTGEIVTLVGKVNGDGITNGAIELQDQCYIVPDDAPQQQ
jgi:TM2 domain-containing membrane protein YozV